VQELCYALTEVASCLMTLMIEKRMKAIADDGVQDLI
jgi:hypothetical protein